MNTIETANAFLINTYTKFPVELVRGKGSFLWDSEGKKYLDFYGGHAVCLLGHSHPDVVKAINAQAKKLLFYSNAFHTAPSALLAEELAKTLAPKKYRTYFTNSGSEANETAIKIARRYTLKHHIISFKNSFHGRGITSLAATGISSYHKDDPNLDSFTTFAEFGDIESVKKAWQRETAAVICEAIQSIGGINVAEKKFYVDLADFCNKKGILLIFDEVQTGLGRTGSFWFSKSQSVFPDIITTAKGLGGGIPLAAVIVAEKISKTIKTGEHATTFGGGPVQTAAGLATVNFLLKKGFLASIKQKSALIRKLLSVNKTIKKIRGKGLLLGIELTAPNAHLVNNCLKDGLIIGNSYNPNVFRIMPPLTINENEIKTFAKIFLKNI